MLVPQSPPTPDSVDDKMATSLDVDAVLAQLTLDEKIALLSGIDFWHTAAVPRLGVPTIRLSDGPNGVRGTRFFDSVPSSCLPCGTALGATFDRDLLREVGHLLADEARAKGAHAVLGPTINIQRLPLGGRGFESFSEDPTLAGLLAASYCQGLADKGIASVPKHFVCNDMEHERMAVDVKVTDRALHEVYLKPFQITLREAPVPALMTAYNKVNGVHASESPYLLEKVLRGDWGFDGMVVSDWFGTYSTAAAVNVGLDLEMPGPARFRGGNLRHAVNANTVAHKALDARVRNVLTFVSKAMGAGIPEHAPETLLNRPDDQQLLRRAAADSIVLLKNESVLPFAPSKSTVVIGPTARVATYCGGGSASLNPYEAVTPWQGIEAQAQGPLAFAQGVYGHQMLPLLGKSMRAADGNVGFELRIYNDAPTGPAAEGQTDARPLVETRHVVDANMFFIDYSHPNLSKNGVWYADAEGTFTPDVSGTYDLGLAVQGTGWLYVDGQLLVANAGPDQRPGTSFLGSGTVEETGSLFMEAGRAYRILVQWGCSKTSTLKVANMIDFGHGGMRIGSCRRLEVEEGIAEAVAAAKGADQVVLCVGLGAEWESEGEDRVTMALPPNTDALVQAVLAAAPHKTAVVVQSGTPMDLPWVEAAPAVLQAWYGGNATGHAVADVLFGTVNPAGKLPLSYPRRLQDLPTHINYRAEAGRCLYGEDVYVGYRYLDRAGVEPLFPFGHGLSYTSFQLGQVSVDQSTNDVSARLSVTNTGTVSGSCAVQLYVIPPAWESRAVPAIPQRPSQELRAFAKVHDLAPGASTTVTLTLDAVRDTSYWDETEDAWCSRAGTYGIRVGQSSRDAKTVEGKLTVDKTVYWKGLKP